MNGKGKHKGLKKSEVPDEPSSASGRSPQDVEATTGQEARPIFFDPTRAQAAFLQKMRAEVERALPPDARRTVSAAEVLSLMVDLCREEHSISLSTDPATRAHAQLKKQHRAMLRDARSGGARRIRYVARGALQLRTGASVVHVPTADELFRECGDG